MPPAKTRREDDEDLRACEQGPLFAEQEWSRRRDMIVCAPAVDTGAHAGISKNTEQEF